CARCYYGSSYWYFDVW
nr:immunoglobulin heavy chain junction region [Mus musculus]NSM04368.1 immunoglobulin heavy chain junction region [Mus musculus]NSM04668.1 immunoglobulin heavy chain junction region [Mus musculus]NSM05458.1 immunoglobulin heavy chain junction region [Mus musculus]NSM05759.1 immunoglobulin heavy chain junction region [Mus musculus]